MASQYFPSVSVAFGRQTSAPLHPLGRVGPAHRISLSLHVIGQSPGHKLSSLSLSLFTHVSALQDPPAHFVSSSPQVIGQCAGQSAGPFAMHIGTVSQPFASLPIEHNISVSLHTMGQNPGHDSPLALEPFKTQVSASLQFLLSTLPVHNNSSSPHTCVQVTGQSSPALSFFGPIQNKIRFKSKSVIADDLSQNC